MNNTPNFSSLLPPGSANCGNPTIDRAVIRGAMALVWNRLDYNFPACKANSYKIFSARRDGNLQSYIFRNYPQLMQKASPCGKEEWETLGLACMNFILGTKRFPVDWLYLHPSEWPCSVDELHKQEQEEGYARYRIETSLDYDLDAQILEAS